MADRPIKALLRIAPEHVFRTGDLLVITTGEYSDREWSGPVRFVKEVSARRLVDEFMAQSPRQPRPDDFMPWLVKAGYVEDQPCTEWDVGSYSSFEP